MLNVFIPGPNVLNTIATAMGSGLKAGMACAFACGAGLLLWALTPGRLPGYGELPAARALRRACLGLPRRPAADSFSEFTAAASS